MPYVLYLRKSRTDRDAEASGSGETLARHRAALLALAERQGLEVGAVYEEIVSGETIAARPCMRRLLAEVELGQWEGVLVTEVERLARGDSIDQGIVARAFRLSGTRIVTPAKTYDPANEFDEEYFEFGLFMSRREYRVIQRRMLEGRAASVREGKYMGKTDPYGYVRVRVPNAKGFTLRPNPAQAAIVRELFARRLAGESVSALARRLNRRGECTGNGNAWSAAAVLRILRSSLYAGYVTWGRRPAIHTVNDGVVSRPRRFSSSYLQVKGLHPALISEADFNEVQRLLDAAPSLPVRHGRTLRNPFAGLLFCARCGRSMAYAAASDALLSGRLLCRNANCRTVSAACRDVEDALLRTLRLWLGDYRIPVAQRATEEQTRQLGQAERDCVSLGAALDRLRKQFASAADLVEQGVYSPAWFLSRCETLQARQAALQEELHNAEERRTRLRSESAFPTNVPAETAFLLSAYALCQTAAQKNALLKSILTRVYYRKDAPERGNGDSALRLELFRRFE